MRFAAFPKRGELLAKEKQDLLGAVPSQLDATDYRDVDGIILPTTRRAYDQLTPDHLLMVAIDMSNITLR